MVGYTYRFELREVADRVIAELMPGHVAGHGRSVQVVRGNAGDFAVAAHINGAKIPMVLDTGASSVVLTQEAAKAAGLPIEVLNYSVNVDTANGRTRAAAVTLDRLAPHQVDFTLNGTSIPFAVPKEYAIALSPQLRFVGTELDNPERRKMTLSGRVDIPDGSYNRNFDRISGVVGGVADRQIDQFSKPITETMPWINDIWLDLRVNAQNIDVASRIPFARVDAVVETEGLKVTGTLPKMSIVGRAKVAASSDSKITYAINQLVFDVDHLWLDFQGDATRPYIDADIRAAITKSGTSTMSSASAIGADLNTDNQTFTDVVLVSVGYSGVLTADAKAEDLRFSDNKGDSAADVQCLILFKRKCTDTSTTGSAAPPISSAALLGDLGPSLLKPFQKLLGIDSVFDQFTFDFDAAGNVGASGSKKLGNQISLATRVQTGGQDRLYNVSFNFRATDRLSAGGLWRRAQQFSQGAAVPTEVYEFKIKYKQPLE